MCCVCVCLLFVCIFAVCVCICCVYVLELLKYRGHYPILLAPCSGYMIRVYMYVACTLFARYNLPPPSLPPV